jgi:FtsP/CotA-like multicopper oxidase with cupredoxin domain
MEFRVQPYAGTDLSMDPAMFTEGKLQMIPRPAITLAELNGAARRRFQFGRSGGTDGSPWSIKTDNNAKFDIINTGVKPAEGTGVGCAADAAGFCGPELAGGGGLTADMHRLSAGPETGQMEVWSIENNSGGWSHPVHIHFEEGRILSRDGRAPPIWERWARKDVYRVGPGVDSSSQVVVALRFREFLGTFMEHCHNTQHEDHSMLLRWDIIHPGQTVAVPTPEGGWEGTFWEPSYVLPGWRSGTATAPAAAQ